MLRKQIFRGALVLVLCLGIIAAVWLPTVAADGFKPNCESNEQLVQVPRDNAVDEYFCCPESVAQAKGGKPTGADCMFGKYINPAVKVMAALAGVAVVLGIMLGGIQYASSGGDPQKTAAGKAKVTRAIVALFVFFFLGGLLQFMSPGGIATNPAPKAGIATAENCSKDFFGLKPWFAYLDQKNFDTDCSIKNFSLLGDDSTGTPSGLPAVLLAVVDDLVRIAGLVAVAYVIIGGVKYVTSQGEPDATKNARETIINALIGLAIVIVAAAVVSFLGNRIN